MKKFKKKIKITDLKQDGSKRGLSAGAGFDIHTQGFAFEGACRLAFLLNELFNVDAWPTIDLRKDKETNQYFSTQCTVYVSADCNRVYSNLISPYIETDLLSTKTHPFKPTQQSGRNSRNKANFVLSLFKNNIKLREDVFYQVPQGELDRYIAEISSR